MTELQGFIASRTPPGWETRPLWSLFRRRKHTGYADEELLSVYRDYGVIPKSSRDDNHNKESDDLSGYQLVTEGSLVTNKMKAWQGSIAISRYRGIVSPAYYVYEPLSAECDQFLHYLLRSEPYIALYGRISKGVRVNQWDLEHEALRNVPVMLPDLDTQKTIADFLDRETARIDQLIEKKQRLANVLKERLLSELERLTTPNEPSQSELVPFRWVCRVTEGQVNPTAPEWADKPLIAPNHIESRTGRLISIETAEDQGAISGKYAFPAGTVVYSKIRPNLAKACVSPVAGMCSADMYPILPNKSLRPQFLLMQLLSAKFTDWATLESMRVAMPKINRETLGGYRFWVPALDVQDENIKGFFTEQEALERLTDKVRKSIIQMREFRSALITAAVTGQIDVATWDKQGQTDRRLDEIEEAMQA
ncbi:type I restriction enzyme, S subunit [Roseovarius lutimaris]|uniref:Type I restriction enzyme, S subunit n=1 Tax=Roseovarius lutimaris TaxID=1005928 RepID=A0A1I5FQJ7_9RHOB|nr:restriction endonuclease subunit S [Roseovarius lutimaris]SFO25906.1 type I restriction enzyme, S subunit [Roseovarius lutimaris]